MTTTSTPSSTSRTTAARSRLQRWLTAPPPDAAPLDRRTTMIFIVSIALLILFHYFGKPESYRNGAVPAWLPMISPSTPAGLAPFVHWAASSVVLRLVIPFAVVLFVFREPLSAYGWRWRGVGRHLPLYAGLYGLMLPLILWASTLASFQAKYPFYRGGAGGGPGFWLYETLYGVQFLGVEFFFRGFLTFALFRRFGYNALLIMAIPYVMVHFNKPLPETFGALGAALVLGALALRAGSCIPGFLLHWAVGITMDVLAVARQS